MSDLKNAIEFAGDALEPLKMEFKERVKNPFFIPFIISFLITNWDIFYIFIFGEFDNAVSAVSEAKRMFKWWPGFWGPFIIACLYGIISKYLGMFFRTATKRAVQDENDFLFDQKVAAATRMAEAERVISKTLRKQLEEMNKQLAEKEAQHRLDLEVLDENNEKERKKVVAGLENDISELEEKYLALKNKGKELFSEYSQSLSTLDKVVYGNTDDEAASILDEIGGRLYRDLNELAQIDESRKTGSNILR